MAKSQITEGLETQVTNTVTGAMNESSNFESIEFLRENKPFFPEEITSKKCNIDREALVQAGMNVVRGNENIPELFVLLCLWWENKAARKTIKAALDQEAYDKGYEPNDYIQQVIRSFVMPYDALQDAVNRMKYAITYFKPRDGAKIKETIKQVSIDGTIYNVPISVLTEAKNTYGTDREAIKEFLLSSPRVHVGNNEIEEL